MNLISVHNLGVSFGRKAVLWDVDLTVNAGEIVTIVGPNGSGKSTLLRALIGAVPVTGTITRAPNLRVGYVPQKLQVDGTMPMTVARFMSLPRRQAAQAVMRVLEQVGIQDMSTAQMTDLSGGQFQRALLARALLEKPQLLLLDEPTQGLDQPGTADFYAMIADVRKELNCAVLMISHDLHVVMSASDRVVCLNGHVCCHGTPEVVSSTPEYRALFGQGTRGTLALYRHEHDHDHDDHKGHSHVR
jgi:zinc transport system ATP-binding protein